MSVPQDHVTQALLDNMDSVYDTEGWHGPNLIQALTGVPESARTFRSAPGEPSIWEYLVHAAYWKYVVYVKATGADEPFGEEGHDFFVRPNGIAAWESDLVALAHWHGRVRNLAATWPAEKLHDIPPDYGTSAFRLFIGIAAHDAYHTGQIEQLKRLFAAT